MTQPPAHALAPEASRGWSPPPREALDYPVFFNPEPAVARYQQFRSAIKRRLFGLVLSLVIWAVIGWFNRDNLDTLFWTIFGISLAISIALLVRTIVQSVLAKRAIGRLHEGLALGIGRGGLYLDDYLAGRTSTTSSPSPAGRAGRGASSWSRPTAPGERCPSIGSATPRPRSTTPCVRCRATGTTSTCGRSTTDPAGCRGSRVSST